MIDYNFVECYDVVLLAKQDLTIAGRKIEPGEPIFILDKVEELSVYGRQNVTKTGSNRHNREVFWEEYEPLSVNFKTGVFSMIHQAISTNSQVNEIKFDQGILKTEILDLDEYGETELKFKAEEEPTCYYYNKTTYEFIKIPSVDITAETKLDLSGDPLNTKLTFKKLLDDATYDEDFYQNAKIRCVYGFKYNKTALEMNVGSNLMYGFLELWAKTRLKDDKTGKITTGVIHIPRLRLLSGLSIRLEGNFPSALGFRGEAHSIGERGWDSFVKLISLEDDIDSDI